MTADDETSRMRLDVFLWRARFFKARTAATEAVEKKGARIERDGQVRRVDKPAIPVEPGDILSFRAPSGPKLVRILSLPTRRGPPSEAALCYEAVVGDNAGEA
ncbi:MAG TPA: RNA-binding protein [Hyphomonadaceae bacterium]|jgi:ribosome-associated heat shock protein Hsp15|nr:RNA-binding protein [Hyphomonadaceae bacterium]HPI49563.1 RNA-binding protein [Hyphomonadaceae bacterium]